ncbi:MAG TPA: DUF433 domain-containing protein [Gaiellaceae bacterium]|nr:DUF433 domain-containing protein [Gaiellaceae bacterium]
MNTPVSSLLDRRVYGMLQVDQLLSLKHGTASRWIDGYTRAGKRYPPVVRVEPTGDEIVTWGEFVETRLLAEYRNAGVSLLRMRPAVDQLRETFHPIYPLAHARPYLDIAGRELVLKVQELVGLDRELQLVVVRNNQVVLAESADKFARAAIFGQKDGVVEMLRPVTEIEEVVMDPLRQFGEPIIADRGVRTEIISEQLRAGESIDSIASLYELSRPLIEAALRYELVRSGIAA